MKTVSNSVEPRMKNGGAGGRPKAACCECQRRKQKCNRQWPCNHCQMRKVAHLCQFNTGAVSPTKDKGSDLTNTHKSKKRKVVLQDTDDSQGVAKSATESDLTLRSLGYLDTEKDSIIDDDIRYRSASKTTSPSELPNDVKEALRNVPPRPYADVLMKHAMTENDYCYTVISPNAFFEEYEDYWSSRNHSVDLIFECLVLRICALSTQCISVCLKEKLERELGEDTQSLTERYHHAASVVSGHIEPGGGALTQVQQYFLKAVWYKGEGQYSHAWRCLGETIREAQEIGLHKEPTSDHMSEFDKDMRRAIWCTLYVWDRGMSQILGRPFLIDSSSCNTQLPSGEIDRDPQHPEIPAPIVVRVIEYEWSTRFYEVDQVSKRLDVLGVSKLRAGLDSLMASMPAVFSVKTPDTRWDTYAPRLIFERFRLHIEMFQNYLMLFRPFLLRFPHLLDESPDTFSEYSERRDYALAAISYGIKLIQTCRRMADRYLPTKVKYNVLAFSCFDAAKTFYSTLQQDGKRRMIKRNEMIGAMGETMQILHDLGPDNKIAAKSFGVMKSLIAKLNLSPNENKLLVERKPQVGQMIEPFPLEIVPPFDPSSVRGPDENHNFNTDTTETDIVTPQWVTDSDGSDSLVPPDFELDASFLDEILNWSPELCLDTSSANTYL